MIVGKQFNIRLEWLKRALLGMALVGSACSSEVDVKSDLDVLETLEIRDSVNDAAVGSDSERLDAPQSDLEVGDADLPPSNEVDAMASDEDVPTRDAGELDDPPEIPDVEIIGDVENADAGEVGPSCADGPKEQCPCSTPADKPCCLVHARGLRCATTPGSNPATKSWQVFLDCGCIEGGVCEGEPLYDLCGS